MSEPLPKEYIDVLLARAKRVNGSAIRRAEWPDDWAASPVVVLQLCGEVERLRAVEADLRKALELVKAELDHWHGLVPRADRVQLPFEPVP